MVGAGGVYCLFYLLSKREKGGFLAGFDGWGGKLSRQVQVWVCKGLLVIVEAGFVQ